MTTIDVAADRELIRQGDAGREFLVVVDGEAEVRRDGEVIAHGPGTFFGEMAFLLERPRLLRRRCRDFHDYPGA